MLSQTTNALRHATPKKGIIFECGFGQSTDGRVHADEREALTGENCATKGRPEFHHQPSTLTSHERTISNKAGEGV